MRSPALLLRLILFLPGAWLVGCSFGPQGLRSLGEQGASDGSAADSFSREASPPSDGPWEQGRPSGALRLVFRNGERAALEDFVVPVFLTPPRFDYQAAAADGSDLQFFDDDEGTVLPHEIERWAPGGTSIVWVRVPLVTAHSDSDFILLRYGGGALSQRPATEVWQGSFQAVYHLSDDLSRPPPQLRDSSPSDFDGTLAEDSSSSARSSEGQLAAALSFSGEPGCHVLLGSHPEFDVEPGEAATLEAWFKAEAGQSGPILYKEYDCQGWSVVLQENGELMARYSTGDGCKGKPALDYHLAWWDHSFADGLWHYLALVLDRPQQLAALYLDGQLVQQLAINNSEPATATGQAKLGSNWKDDPCFAGSIDEARVSGLARSADWLNAQHAAGRDGLLRYVPR